MVLNVDEVVAVLVHVHEEFDVHDGAQAVEDGEVGEPGVGGDAGDADAVVADGGGEAGDTGTVGAVDGGGGEVFDEVEVGHAVGGGGEVGVVDFEPDVGDAEVNSGAAGVEPGGAGVGIGTEPGALGVTIFEVPLSGEVRVVGTGGEGGLEGGGVSEDGGGEADLGELGEFLGGLCGGPGVGGLEDPEVGGELSGGVEVAVLEESLGEAGVGVETEHDSVVGPGASGASGCAQLQPGRGGAGELWTGGTGDDPVGMGRAREVQFGFVRGVGRRLGVGGWGGGDRQGQEQDGCETVRIGHIVRGR